IAQKIRPADFYKATGIPEVNGYCPIAKLLWFRDQQPEIYQKAAKFLLLEDFLVYRLTGRFVTNPALMCSTGYFNIQENRLWTEIMELCSLDKDKIPEVLPCATPVGTLIPSVAQELGLSPSTVVATG